MYRIFNTKFKTFAQACAHIEILNVSVGTEIFIYKNNVLYTTLHKF